MHRAFGGLIVLVVAATFCACSEAASGTGATGAPALRLVTVVKGMVNPIEVVNDGTQRCFIIEQPGRLRLWHSGGANEGVEKTPYLDITDRVEHQGEMGFLGVAFHPDFANNGYFYVNYTARKNGPRRTVISEFKADPAAKVVDPATERIVLEIRQPYNNHNGGSIQFGPDGMLYIGMGDGGSGGDPQNRAQNPKELLGKLLRIDVNDRSPYAVPKDNPFVNDPRFRPEIWAWGIRNAWRLGFDRQTGALFIGDVGQHLWEEVDVIVKDGNYGWRIREGTHPFKPDERPITGNLIEPIAEYGRDKGMSVTGGNVYRGKTFPALKGIYFYADYASGRFWGLRYDEKTGRVLANEELTITWEGRPTLNRVQPSGFGEDVEGEIYVCDHSRGNVYQLVAE